MSRHLLLTGLGVSPRPGRYQLAGAAETHEATLAPVALLHLLAPEERPDWVLAFCTEKALADNFPKLEAELAGIARVEAVKTPDGITPEDIELFLNGAVNAVARGGADRLTLDLTQGPRHFALLLYLSGLYLQSLGNVNIEAAYYAFESPGTRPFFDLRPLLELPRWIHAIDTLTESRDALPLANLVRRAERKAPHLGQAARLMSLATEAFASGLPLELGQVAARLLEELLAPLRKGLRQEFQLPLAEQISDKFEEWLDGYRLAAPSGEGWKGKLALTEELLRRQARLIDDLLAHGNLRSALGLMNEWVVSWAVLRSAEAAHWLKRKPTRHKAAKKLDALAEVNKKWGAYVRLTSEQQEFARFWGELCELRNGLAHHGMRPQVVSSSADGFRANLDRVRDFWTNTMRHLPQIPLEFGEAAERALLVSPVGERPGVLFSALRALHKQGISCDTVVAICSPQTEPRVDEALERTGWQGELHLARFEDPFSGIDERPRLLGQAMEPLARAASVYVNVTGGTTLLGLFAEELAGKARSLAKPVRRFGLIDRRPSEEQRTNPWIEGELLWLDAETDGED
jgi:hypothetical protein